MCMCYTKQLFKIIRYFAKIYVYYLTIFFLALYDMMIFLCQPNTTYSDLYRLY